MLKGALGANKEAQVLQWLAARVKNLLKNRRGSLMAAQTHYLTEPDSSPNGLSDLKAHCRAAVAQNGREVM